MRYAHNEEPCTADCGVPVLTDDTDRATKDSHGWWHPACRAAWIASHFTIRPPRPLATTPLAHRAISTWHPDEPIEETAYEIREVIEQAIAA